MLDSPLLWLWVRVEPKVVGGCKLIYQHITSWAPFAPDRCPFLTGTLSDDSMARSMPTGRLLLLAVLPGRDAESLAENAAQVVRILEARVFGNPL